VNYTVVFEATPTGYSAYVPDLPGCVAAGKTRAEVERLIRSAIRSHVRTLRSLGESVPESTSWSETVAAQDA
jgi:predicted RNase H-like HicB family nuclease